MTFKTLPVRWCFAAFLLVVWLLQQQLGYAAIPDSLNASIPDSVKKSYDLLEDPSYGLSLARKDFKYGFVDANGVEVIPVQFESAFPFHDNYAVVSKDGVGWFYINRKGVQVSPLVEMACSFSEGWAASIRNDSVIFFDTNFNIRLVLNRKYMGVDWKRRGYFFNGNRLPVCRNGGKLGFLDRSGSEKSDFVYDEVRAFAGGWASVRKGRYWFSIDTNGRLITKKRYDFIGRVASGRARFADNFKYGFFDAEGYETVAAQYNYALNFINGSALVLKDSKWLRLDTSGSEKAAGIDSLYRTSYNMFIFSAGGKLGVLDENGLVVLGPEFDSIDATRLSDGLFLLKANGKFGVWSSRDRKIIPPVYDSFYKMYNLKKICMVDRGKIDVFSNELVAGPTGLTGYHDVEYPPSIVYTENGKTGLMNTQEHTILTPLFDTVIPAMGGFILVKNRKYGFYKMHNGAVPVLPYDSICAIGNSLHFGVKKDGRWGIANSSFRLITAIAFDEIEYKKGNIFVRAGERWGYLYYQDSLVFPVLPQGAELAHTDVLCARKNGRVAVINVNGRLLTDFKYDSVTSCVRHFLAGWHDGTFEILDRDYLPINEKRYFKIGKLLYLPSLILHYAERDGKAGFLSHFAEERSPFIYDTGSAYLVDGNGNICIPKNGKWGCIDTNNRIVIPFLYDTVAYLDYLQARVNYRLRRNGLWEIYLTVRNGFIPGRFDSVQEFGYRESFGGSIAVKKNGKWMLIDRAGKRISGRYDGWLKMYLWSNFYRVSKRGEWGLINNEGKQLVPCRYASIAKVHYFNGEQVFCCLTKQGKHVHWCNGRQLNIQNENFFVLEEGEF